MGKTRGNDPLENLLLHEALKSFKSMRHPLHMFCKKKLKKKRKGEGLNREVRSLAYCNPLDEDSDENRKRGGLSQDQSA